ncbi:ATP-dependent Clp protease adapter ClpS [Salinicola avicenniae]|uniref:ATP-dependent Clp protease adapter ClpS n=1 Tax=Salinicola avicenniae TaxID=2916836 RepID=UPI002073FB32|nr:MULTISPECIES: ATP-dependent Clp protease adapter ClpS [unclassified Salinicola]
MGMTRPPEPDHEEQGDVAEQTSEPKLAPPPMYKVVLYNDDYTPMEFVVEVLQRFFAMDSEKAVQIMLAVHTQGKATCGIFTRDVAETKCHQVNEYARECEHPLMCDVDAAD